MKSFLLHTSGLLAFLFTGMLQMAAGQTPPSVASTPTATNIGGTTARLNGQVTAAGSSAITGRGFVLSVTQTNNDPFINGAGVIDIPVPPNAVGIYFSNRTGLAALTSYTFKAYARNISGITYSNATSFTTLKGEPSAHATGFGVTARTETSLDFGWTAAVGNPDGYLVLRRTTPSATLTSAPVDGTTYTVGSVIGQGTVIAVGSSITAATSGLAIGSGYATRIFPYNNSGSAINYLTTANPPLIVAHTLSTEPSSHAASFTVGARTTTTIALNFSAASTLPNATGYLILRRAGAVPPTGLPADGVSYALNATIGDGTVASVVTNAAATTATISSLTAATDYSFTIIPFGHNAASTTTYNYRTTATIPSLSTRTLVAAPTVSATAMVFSNVTTSATTASWSYGGTAAGFVVLRSTAPGTSTDVPANGVSYNVGDVIGTSTVIGTGNSLSATTSGLTSGSQYQYRVFPYNGTGNDLNYRTTAPLTSARYTLSPEPTAHAAGFTVTNVGQTSITLTFSAANTLANGAGYLILRRAGAAAPTGNPVDATNYAVGNTIGDGVVAARIVDATTTTVTITGLAANSTHSFSLVPFNFLAASTQTFNYLTSPTIPTVTGQALQAEPTTSSVLSFATINSSGYTVNWTASTGATQFLLLRTTATGTTVPNTAPSDNVAYQVGDVIGNATVAFVGSTRTFSISGMAAATAHAWAVYPFNGTTSPRFNYRTTSPGSAFQYTTVAAEPNQHSATLTAQYQVGSGNMDLTFAAANTLGNATGYVLLRRANAAVASVPADGVAYTANTTIGTSAVAAVITDATQTTLTLTGLTDNTRWHFQLFPYNDDVVSAQTANYRTVATAPTANDSTSPVAPASQPLNLSFTNLSTTGMTLSWQAPVSPTPVPTGYLVLRTTAAGTVYPNTNPVDGTTYTVGTTLGNATVVFSGTTLTTAVTALANNSVYSYSIFGYRNNGVARRYNVTSPLQGQRTTLTTEPSGLGTLSFPDNDTTQISASFGFTGSTPDGYLLLRTTAAGTTQPNTNPVEGTGYTAGNVLGNATVVYSGSNASAVASALAIGSRYQFRLFLYNGTGATGNTNYTAATNGFYYTLARVPQRQPATFVAQSVTNTSVALTFPPASTLTNAVGYLVLMKQGNTPFTAAPANASSYTVGDAIGNGEVVAITNASAINETITGLQASTLYQFALYPFNTDGASTVATHHYRTAATVASDTAYTIDYLPLAFFRTVQAGSWQLNTTWERLVLDALGAETWIPLPPTTSVTDSTFNVEIRHSVFLANDVRVRNIVLDSAKTTIDDYNISIYGQLTRRLGQFDANFNSFVEFIVPVDSSYSQSIPDNSFENDEVNELIINNANGVALAAGCDLRVMNNITLSTGVLDINGNKLTLAGDVAVLAGQIDAVPGNITFARDANLSLAPTPFLNNMVDTIVVNMDTNTTLSLNGSLHVKHHLTMQSGNLNTQNNLRLLADSVHTAYIGQVRPGSLLSGNVTVEQYIRGRRAFRFVAHPFSSSIALSQLIDDVDITGAGGATNGFTPSTTNNPSAFVYRPLIANPNVANDPGWSPFTSTNGAGNNAWPSTQGIRMLFRGSKGQGLTGTNYTPNAVTIDMSGPVNVGDVQLALPVGTNSGFTIVGNPYPSPINLRFIGRGDSVRPNYHVYNPYAGTSGAYISVPATVNYVIPAYSGFFASATQAGTGLNELDFSEAVKSTDAPALLLRTATSNRQVLASISVNGYNRQWDLLWLMKQENARDSVDFVDARKFPNDQVNAYTLSQEGRNLSIDTRSFNKSGDDSIRLGFTSSFVGNFSFRVDSLVLNSGASLLLVDRFLGTTTQLTPGISYPFSTTAEAASAGNNRFVLVHRTPSTLPVAGFRNFIVQPQPDKHELQWTYKQSQGKVNFVVERSGNGVDFAKIGQVEAAAAASSFRFAADLPVQEISYYRLLANNGDGSKEWSNVVKVHNGRHNALVMQFVPNPVGPGAVPKLQSSQAIKVLAARLVDAGGQVVASFGQMQIGAGVQELPGMVGLKVGMYYLQCTTENGQTTVPLTVQ